MLGLRPYQEAAADFIFENDRSMILAAVGAGKTAIALTAMQEYVSQQLVKRWLVIAPKRVCTDVWPQEAKKWSQLSVNVAVGTPAARIKAVKAGVDVVVINYDNLQWLCAHFPKLPFGGVVFDELTRLKNASGKRFKALHTIIDQIPIRIGLTGSFTSNGLEDVFGQVKIIDQQVLGRSKGAFLQQYFWCSNPQFGDWTPRPDALQKVMDRIKLLTFVLENSDYTDSLPPLNIVELRCDMANREPYLKMKKDFVAEFPNAKAIAANAGVVTAKLQQMSGGWVYDTHTVASDVPGKFITTKTPHWFDTTKFDMLDDLLRENQRAPALVWYWYKEELAELQRRYPHAQTLDDENAVNRWNAGDIELLLAHPMSAGHGINLQGQNKMVFLTLPWSLELYEQAIGRLHRGGQTRAVWCYVLLTNNTVDDQVWSALRDKRDMSDVAVAALR